MKKILLSIALALAAAGAGAATRTAEQALDIARNFIAESQHFSNIHTSALTLAQTATAQMAKGNKQAPAYYVCNIEQGGFVIVSGDDRFKDILGFSASGTYDSSNLPDGFAYWMEFLSNEMSAAIANGYEAEGITTTTYSANAGKSVEPLITTKWDQNKPYNNRLNGYMTGCVATGTAQVMKYWKYPTKGIGTHTGGYAPNFSADFGSTTYDWANMLNEYGSGWESKEEVDAVSTLMLHLGVATDMQWGKSQSATVNMYAAHALINYFGYNKYLYAESRDHVSLGAWKALIIDQLQSGHPLCYSGQGNGGGHFFVCDGYDATTGKFHFNWGWSGYCDGYYEITSLEPGTGGIGAGAGTYNLMQQIFVNVQPTELGTPSVHFEVKEADIKASGKNAAVTLKHIDNNNTSTVSGTIGIAVYGSDGSLVNYISSEKFPMSGLHIGATYNDSYKFNADLSSIPDGTYTICVAVGMENIEGVFPIRANYDNTTYYTLNVTGSGITITPQSHDINLEATSIKLTSNSEGNMFQNVMAEFAITIKNNSAQEFNDEIGVYISGGRGSNQYITVPASLTAGETKTINVYGAPTLNVKNGYSVKACYGANGSYTTIGDAITLNILDETLSGISIIKDFKPTSTATPCYNLAGQRVNANAKGIIIQNGKKTIKF